MALRNLYRVTNTLINLLTQNITKNIDMSLDGRLTVTAIPPDKVEDPSNTLSLHLYHVTEDPYYKNALGPGSDVPNVAKAPMALSLFYILTAHHEVDPVFDAEAQQKLMGYALKTFQDFPVITDQTRVNETGILDADLRGKDNSLQVILRSVSAEDALAFWNSEQTRTARLSAYYEVRIVMLEPEEPKTMPGIVLNLGTFLVQIGTPHLDRSQSLVQFKIPQKNGGTVHQVEATPARVTLDSSANPPEPHNRLLLLGTNLTIGRSRSLFLKNGIWAKLLPPDGPVEQTVVDLAENPDWKVEFQTDRVSIKLASTLRHVKPDGTTVDLPVLPGFYSAFVRSVKDEKVISNEIKQITVSSNEVGFAVAPRIVGHEAPAPDGSITVNVGTEFSLLDVRLPADSIQVIVSGVVYVSHKPGPAPCSSKGSSGWKAN
jgi:Pvc16 N-terminal domain